MAGASPFAAALEALQRPLAFAARDDFARLARVKDLEASVRTAAARGAGLAIPGDAARALEDLAARFAAPLAEAEREPAVRAALAALAPYQDPAWSEQALGRPLTVLPGVGPRRAALLAQRGLHAVHDVLLHLPSRYDDRRSLVAVGELAVGHRATFVARVLLADFVSTRGRGGRPLRAFQAVVGDETGSVNLKWFHGGDTLKKSVHKGATLLVTGEVRRWRFAKELTHPEIELLEPAPPGGATEPAAPESPLREALPPVDTSALRRIVPDYPTPEGIHPRALRGIVAAAVAEYADLVPGHLPDTLVRERGLPAPAAALRFVHDPPQTGDVAALLERRTPAHERLVLEELYLLELGLACERVQRAAEPALAFARAAAPGVEAALPWPLTGAQTRAWAEIRADLARPHPMSRLLQGDVGSGKTALAFLAAVAAAESGAQAALMAPTELLAEQHLRTLDHLASGVAARGGRRLRVALLSSSLPRAEATATRRSLAAGELDLVVGTHALVQGGVRFARLGLAIVDEQHRFGVLQRAALAGKAADGLAPHLLVMTATPIPRTLALTLYGDLDVSVLDELPPGRAPVATEILRAGEGRRVMAALRACVARGEQCYVVYPVVEESEKSDLRAATTAAERIAAALPELRVDLVHGRLDATTRAAAMARFERGESAILVATTVIEVGVDVPNATLIVVEHAERFGLAQLHQLRGRVGRGARPGRCLLVARATTEDGEARLRALAETTDGFVIAERDLAIRGPGEFLGTRQSGRLPDLRVADLLRDARLIAVAREAALAAVRRDPTLARAPALARAVAQRWGERLALVGVG